MTRRSFTAALAAGLAAAADGAVVLEAIHGARLPATLRLGGRLASHHPYFELRTYAGFAEIERIFARAGLPARRLGRMRFLIPFDSLEQRSQAWDRFNSDPEWALLRRGLRLTAMTIYRQPGGRIFEMSL
ncbi:MAG TPA: hypothetical protein VKV74_13215 [Bryobacteraceae bacterium]|nr:hypothetical protein [Bryobacteraceae bacterium]